MLPNAVKIDSASSSIVQRSEPTQPVDADQTQYSYRNILVFCVSGNAEARSFVYFFSAAPSPPFPRTRPPPHVCAIGVFGEWLAV